MSTENQAETPNPQQPVSAGESDSPDKGAALPRRRVNPLVLGIIGLVLLAIGIGWYLYSRGYEDTDDAQVDGHLNPIASRIDGTIRAVYVDDNNLVQVGKLLVDLDCNDQEIALQQSQAQADQATAQVSAAHPNLPITRFTNISDLTSQQAAVVNAEAGLSAAQHDLDSAVAKLHESQAVNERSQADFARYKILFEKEEVAHSDYDQYRATAAAQTQTVISNEAAVASAQKTVEQRRAQLSQQRSKLQQTQRYQEPDGELRSCSSGSAAGPTQSGLLSSCRAGLWRGDTT
jgi:membrane fusion protein (multidrug efflux system)